MTAFNFIAFFLFIVTFNNSHSLRSFDIRWRSINCTLISKSYVDYLNCSLNEWPRNRGNYVSAELQFAQDINSLQLDFTVVLPNRRKNVVQKFHSDGCKRSTYNPINPIISAAFKQLYQYSNFPSRCPLKANVPYNITRLSLNPDYFPGNTPEMKFYIHLNMFSNKVHVLKVQSEANIEQKKSQKGYSKRT